MKDDELAYAPAWRVREMVISKEVSALEMVELFLRRIEELNPKLSAYLTVAAEEARAQAVEAQEAVSKGEEPGPLHGVPVSIKDLEFTKGIRSTMGCAVFRDHVPDEDSVVVERLRRAGAIILGKTNTPEFGQSGTTENRLGDACRNPWDTERTSGGSSGGAGAALAAGLCSLASGSDGGGSIRIPASFCGVFGIKPTQWRVPRYGSVGRGRAPANIFSQSGPMSRTVRDTAIMLQVLAGHDARDPMSLKGEVPDFVSALESGVKALRVGWSPDLGYAPVEPEVAQICSQAARRFEELGCSVEEAEVKLENPFWAWWNIFSSSAYSGYGYLLDDHAGELTPYGRYSLEYGKHLSAAEYARSLHAVHLVQVTLGELLEKYDLLLTPTMSTVAFPVGQQPEEIGGRRVPPVLGYITFSFTINMSGQPAASVPCGFSGDGMPVGLHIIGRAGDEATVLRASAAFEEAYPWADRRPKIS
ncbi:MAG: amidase [Dehalococcoidia bacterium]